jgi:hypothetical protein
LFPVKAQDRAEPKSKPLRMRTANWCELKKTHLTGRENFNIENRLEVDPKGESRRTIKRGIFVVIRSDLRDFVLVENRRAEFIFQIKSETDEYAKGLAKGGSSCPIHLQGSDNYQISYKNVSSVAEYLKSYPPHVGDYILNALLLDEHSIKDEVTVNLLEELTAPEG